MKSFLLLLLPMLVLGTAWTWGQSTLAALGSIQGGGLLAAQDQDPKELKCVQSNPVRTCTSVWNANIKCGTTQWCSATNVTGDVECPKSNCSNTARMKECTDGTTTCTVVPAADVDCGKASPGKCHYTCYTNPDDCPEATPWSCAATACTGSSGTQLPCPGISTCN